MARSRQVSLRRSTLAWTRAQRSGPLWGLVVDDHAFGPVYRLPAQLAGLQAEIHVLVAVPVGLVEAAGQVQDLPSDQQAGAGDDLHDLGPCGAAVVGGLALGRVDPFEDRLAALAVIHQGDAGVLDRAVGVEQSAADDADLGIPVQGRNQGIEPAWGDFHVVVQEQDVATGRAGGAQIAALGEAAILGIDQTAQPPVRLLFGQPVGAAVAGPVVDHDQLPGGGHGVRIERGHAGARQVQLVVDRHDDGDVRALGSRTGHDTSLG